MIVKAVPVSCPRFACFKGRNVMCRIFRPAWNNQTRAGFPVWKLCGLSQTNLQKKKCTKGLYKGLANLKNERERLGQDSSSQLQRLMIHEEISDWLLRTLFLQSTGKNFSRFEMAHSKAKTNNPQKDLNFFSEWRGRNAYSPKGWPIFGRKGKKGPVERLAGLQNEWTWPGLIWPTRKTDDPRRNIPLPLKNTITPESSEVYITELWRTWHSE